MSDDEPLRQPGESGNVRVVEKLPPAPDTSAQGSQFNVKHCNAAVESFRYGVKKLGVIERNRDRFARDEKAPRLTIDSRGRKTG